MRRIGGSRRLRIAQDRPEGGEESAGSYPFSGGECRLDPTNLVHRLGLSLKNVAHILLSPFGVIAGTGPAFGFLERAGVH